jgi:glucose/arabinose dehydrogenase/PKD repeat protein
MVFIWRFVVGAFVFAWLGWQATAPLYARPLVAEPAQENQAEYHGDDANMELPPYFIARTVVSDLTIPTDMAVLPSGDILITEKGLGASAVSKADVRLVRKGLLLPEPVLTLGVNAQEDSGLMGIVLDPNFAQNNYFYLWYSTGEGSLGWGGATFNRLSRFIFDAASGTADPNSETIILDKVAWAPIHNGGGLVFDAQGNLLITTGDAGSDPFSPSTSLAQSLQSLSGKVLRIRPLETGGYTIPEDNPYVGNTQGIRAEIYASGLRNPFRIAKRDADQKIYLIDVGHDTWEEVNLLTPGANYGWPFREGKCAFAQMTNCSPTPVEFTDPLVTYLHPEGLGAGFTALAFYEGTLWPATYQGRLLVSELNLDWVGVVNVDRADPMLDQFAVDLGGVVSMEPTAAGIYLLSIVDGTLRFLYYDEESNHPPTVEWEVTPSFGPAPLNVAFSASAQDEDNDDLLFLWDFGDGSVMTTTLPTASHNYLVDGDYLATLQVLDEDDGRSEILSQLVQVYSGALPTILQENLIDEGRIRYHGGDQFRFSVGRQGDTDGLDPDAPYAWTILLHHNEHAHYLLAEYINEEVLLDVPTKTHSLGATLWYEVQLTMRTENGQEIQRVLELRPRTTTIQVQSWPGPANLTIDQQLREPDDLTVVVVGQEYMLEAPERIVHDGMVGTFLHWVITPSWPRASAEGDDLFVSDRVYALVAPPEANTYVAFYEYSRPARTLHLPSVTR